MAAVADGELFLGVDNSFGGRPWRSRLTDDRAALAVAQCAGVPDIVARVLAGRGVAADAAQAYLHPTLRDLMPDPSTLADMDVAVARLVAAVRAGRPIAVFGDYDVDGATSAALLDRYLTAVGAETRVYIPDRVREGYGPNAPALRRLRDAGADVAVTVDCGTAAFDALAEARDFGLDVIVVDHHLAEARLPDCAAVVNPNRLDDRSGQGALAAVGVTFLLVVALNRALRGAGWFAARREPDLLQWLDLVALGTVCDMVPLTGLNRALVAQGLKVMARRGNPGLVALADVANLDSRPGTYHAGFVFGPRINAGGRVGEADMGYRLLTSDDPEEVAALARQLDRYNAERKAIESTTVEAALAQADDDGPLLMVGGEGWHPGVIGLVASRLGNRFDRPAIAIAWDGELGKGSARSVPGIDIGAAITAARQAGLLVNGGGHPMAAGLTVERRRYDELRDFLSDRVAAGAADRPPPGLRLDGALTVSAATRELLETLEQAGPYGSGNPEPRFAFSGVRAVRADIVGEDHVRCVFAGREGGRLKGIAFRRAGEPLGQALLAARDPLHVAGHLRADDWQGRNGVQLFIDDAAPAVA
jgi:single-stranded-DNA-specific exonuclease